MTTPQLSLSIEGSIIERSVMRDLLGYAVDPEIISLAGGLPAGDKLPVESFRECLNAVLVRDGPVALQYCPQFMPLREWIAELMRRRHVPCQADEVFITNGAQQGLAILSRLFLNPGDPAVIEEVTFTGVQQVTKGRGALVHTIPTDLGSGADMEALESALKQDPAPKLVILIPDFHNPLGVSLSAEKREKAAALAVAYRVPVIEDDPYSWLRFSGETPEPVKAHDQAGMVFYVGSFSKLLAPAFRLGWIVAPREYAAKIVTLRESLDLESSTLIQRMVEEFLSRGFLEPHLERLNDTHRERAEALLEALEKHLGSLATWTLPEGGLFVWVTLGQDIDTWEMFKPAVDRKVAYIPGGAFAVHGGHSNTMRLCFSNQQPDTIREGVELLAEVIRSYG
ncbi:MAG: PLP-dependent aminotransferase family protein [Anaerolineales bacterium]|jgi:DNA-binding transcriptional MocR family regulator